MSEVRYQIRGFRGVHGLNEQIAPEIKSDFISLWIALFYIYDFILFTLFLKTLEFKSASSFQFPDFS